MNGGDVLDEEVKVKLSAKLNQRVMKLAIDHKKTRQDIIRQAVEEYVDDSLFEDVRVVPE